MTIKPTVISVDTAVALTDLSRSTWWRRIAKGDITRVADDVRGRAMLLWAEVAPKVSIGLTPEDEHLVLAADAGNAQAQSDLGQLCFLADKPRAAFYWFGQAAQQTNPDAMQWLGYCHINGKGVSKDENLGLMWLTKAVAHGHAIAQAQMQWRIGGTIDGQPMSDTAYAPEIQFSGKMKQSGSV
jgi:TPR repeat protein